MKQTSDVYEGELERPGLIWQRGEEADVEFAVWPERPVTIGRDPTNTITIESPFVSKAHAVFQFTNGHYLIEDLQSANGTRVNGALVETSGGVVKPGDAVEIGDQRFLFVDRSARSARKGPTGLGKNAKLALMAMGSFVVMGGLMMLLVSAARPAAKVASPATDAAPVAPVTSVGKVAEVHTETTRPVTPAALPTDSDRVREVTRRAEKAGVSAVDALFDEAMLQYRGGRLRDAAQMLLAVQQRAPQHPIAGRRLLEIRRALEQAITDHNGQAARAYSQLRYDAAVNEWEQVLLLADSSDLRYREAQDGIERAHLRGAR